SASCAALVGAVRPDGGAALVLGIGGGTPLAGVISGHAGLRRSGERVLASTVVAGLTTGAINVSLGRLRPSETDNPYIFKPFSGNDALPSGHATLAFALATSLSHEIHNTWA